jgi:hypothetical protein
MIATPLVDEPVVNQAFVNLTAAILAPGISRELSRA